MTSVLFFSALLPQLEFPLRLRVPLLAGAGETGLFPLLLLELQGLLGLGADGPGPGRLPGLPLAPLGAFGGVRTVVRRPGRAESQCPPVLQEIGVDLLVPGLRAENDPADDVPRVVLPLVQTDPEGIFEQDGEPAGAHGVSSFKKRLQRTDNQGGRLLTAIRPLPDYRPGRVFIFAPSAYHSRTGLARPHSRAT